jgi:hypothetical protein
MKDLDSAMTRPCVRWSDRSSCYILHFRMAAPKRFPGAKTTTRGTESGATRLKFALSNLTGSLTGARANLYTGLCDGALVIGISPSFATQGRSEQSQSQTQPTAFYWRAEESTRHRRLIQLTEMSKMSKSFGNGRGCYKSFRL